MNVKNQIVRGRVQNLESDIGLMEQRLITLNDVDAMLGNLRTDMDSVEEKDLRICFIEYHRTIRILDELVRYTVDEMNENHEKLYNRWKSLHEKVVQGTSDE